MTSHMKRLLVLALAGLALSGCVPSYTLVRSDEPVTVAGAIKVKPAVDWNKAPAGSSPMLKGEVWTQNGPVLDAIIFLGGVKDGTAIVGGLNRSMQHLDSLCREEDVAHEAQDEDSVHRSRQGFDVGSMATG